MPEHGRYLYAVTRGLDDAALSGEVGLENGPLEVVNHRGIAAVVSTVDLDEFGEEGLRRNLEDLAWLERVARGHDDVVHAVSRHGPAAPLRLATVCLDDEAVRRRLDEWHDEMTAVLDRIDGRSEWSVKLVMPAPSRTTGVTGTAGGSTGEGSGAAYLMRKKQETQQRATAEQDAAAQADRVYEALAHASVASRRLQPQDPRLSGHQGTMTLNAAFLVEDGEDAAFTDAVSALSSELPEGALKVAGPWPPYSFATLEAR